MATVAFPLSGESPTILKGWSLPGRTRFAMVVDVVGARVSEWRSLEPRTDAWASYGALGLAGLSAVALMLLGSF